MSYFNIVAQTNENTVVTEYEPISKRSDAYQSEAALEKEFIRMLCEQGYEYLPIHTEKDLIGNLRRKLEVLNDYTFTDGEWDRFFSNSIANQNDGIAEKTRRIQEDFVQVLRRDDGTSKNIKLIDKGNVHNNSLQVINQYVVGTDDGANHDNRYDVTILVNGLPLVHVELKRRGVAIREAFNQINRYQRDSFWAGSGLFEYAQIFVISNGTNTKYYSNSTRFNAIKDANTGKVKKEKTSNSFEFTSFWADANNRIIPDLIDFTRTFFAKHTILNVLTKYCVFTSENLLLVMRPYQITATERILNRIEIANNYKKYGNVAGGGYIWHTTGSGKTLTSFKTARLASHLSYIDKVLFVVDRKDLDYQTMKEYDRFEKGAANSNTSTAILKKQLEDDKARIIITTIQKLSTFVNKNKDHPIYNKHVVIIFDECHRSQFGDMHAAIVKNFKKYHLFGFTGTPIFATNTGAVRNPQFFTTEQTFGDQLHTYTIVDAINDKNVLPFRVDYIKTMDMDENMEDEDVWDINREKAFMAPQRIELVTRYILEHFDQKTYRGDKTYIFNTLTNISEVASAGRTAVEEIKQKQRVSGFNSILAVASVPMAKAVRRILENEHYVGDDDYPAVIDKEIYQKANELQLGKGGDREIDTPEVKFLKYHSVCGQCGNRFTRRRNWSHSREKWYCPCGCKNNIYIDDASFYQSIVNVLNKVISEPERLRIESENADPYCPTVDVLRQQKEIDRMMERKNVSFLPVKKTIFACVTEQFDCCELDKSKEMTDLLIEYFRRLLPIEQIELEMVKKVIVSITVKENGRITVRFLNGAEIDEEDNYADSNNALPEDNNEN